MKELSYDTGMYGSLKCIFTLVHRFLHLKGCARDITEYLHWYRHRLRDFLRQNETAVAQ